MINMTRDEEIAFNNFTDLFAGLIAKHGREEPDIILVLVSVIHGRRHTRFRSHADLLQSDEGKG